MHKGPRMTVSAVRQGSLSERSVSAARRVLTGQRRGLGGYLAFVGPAVIASIAYMDPGNFATNIQAGAKYGYGLLWVVLLANLAQGAALLQPRSHHHLGYRRLSQHGDGDDGSKRLPRWT